ncbi:MAG: hypothetical protein IPJ65_14420 [Archangiaceae bacterium]|nr:hypothetical protein [Archangiaceae bacterium]
MAGLLCSVAALAAEGASATVSVYTDDNRVTVVSPTARGGAKLGPVDVSATGGADVISAASVDIQTAASPRGFTEARGHLSAEARWAPVSGAAVTPGYGMSMEPDFMTHLFSLGAQADVLDRAVTVALGYSFGWSRVTRVRDSDFAAFRRTHQLEVSGSYVLSPVAVLDASYGLTVVNGFQANAYRFVRLYAPGEALHGTAVAERTPEWRVRHSGTLRLRGRPAPTCSRPRSTRSTPTPGA